MADANTFWGGGDNQAADLAPDDIDRWETDYGVRLPSTLARALLVQNGGAVRGVALTIEPLDDFTALDDEQWDGVWEDRPSIPTDRGRQFYIGDSLGVGVVLDYTTGPEPRVLLLHHGLGRELRDEGIGSFDDLLDIARLDIAGPHAESHAAPPPPPASLWVTSVGPNFAQVFLVIRQVMGVSPREAKALLSNPPFQVAVGWPSEFKPWREALHAAGASVEVR